VADVRRSRRRPAAEPPEPPGVEAAVEIGLTFLGSRPRTRWEIERRLRRAGASDEVIEAAVERLATLGYADDAAFARWWADQRDRHAPRGRRMVDAELRQRGVPRDVLEAQRAADDVPERAPEDADLPATEAERARVALEGHLRGRPLPTDRRARERVGMFLVRRGFDPETVRGAIRERGALDHDADDSR
jgi:regulatory protein